MCARILILSALLATAVQALLGQAPSLTVTPANLTFTYQIVKGTTPALPAAQTIAIKRSGSGTALTYTISVSPAAPWLIITPLTGKTGGSISVRVNPTSLIAGSYAAVIQVDAQGATGPVTAGVVLTVKSPPPVMTVAPATLTYQWQTDSLVAPPVQTFVVSTDGEPFTYTAALAGGTWLTANPAIGVVLSGSPITVDVGVDTTGLSPGTYTGKITIASTTASNKSVSVTVSLTVNPGTAVLDSIWPLAAPIGSNDTVITIRGSHLFKASVVKANTTDLISTWIGTDVMLATIPKSLMTSQTSINITVLNSPRPASAAKVFSVTPPGPQLLTIVNAASFASVSTPNPQISPGEMITIYGSGMGPSTAIIGAPVANAYPTTLGAPAAMVEFSINNSWVAAPLILVQANQISCQAPFTVPTATGLKLRVTYNSQTSADYTYDGVAAEPGIFTLDSSGRGQAAALNYDGTTSTYTLNSASNPVPKGGDLIFYVTGAGAIIPTPNPDGQLSPDDPNAPTLVASPAVTIGGDAASVVSANAVGGAIGGLAQIRVTVPGSIQAGKDLPIVVVINGRTSPGTATVAVK
jgi:uncharacterized protein (TIGR03437 family)